MSRQNNHKNDQTLLLLIKYIFQGLIVPATSQPWENNGPCTWMMQFPYFNRDKGGSSGIIVMRPTGCPEEEVSAELYASIQGQGGARQGGLHHCVSSLLVSSRLPGTWGCLPSPGCHDPSVLRHRLGIYNYPATTDMDWICSHEEKMEAQKLESSLETGTIKSFFFTSNWFTLVRFSGRSS